MHSKPNYNSAKLLEYSLGASSIATWRDFATADDSTDTQAPRFLPEHLTRHGPIALASAGDPHAPGAVIRPSRDPRSAKTYAAVACDMAKARCRLGFKRLDAAPGSIPGGERLGRLKTSVAPRNPGESRGMRQSQEPSQSDHRKNARLSMLTRESHQPTPYRLDDPF